VKTKKSEKMLALEYHRLRANLDLCEKQLHALCKGERGDIVAMSVPPRPENFDMQFSAAFDELREFRESGFLPTKTKAYENEPADSEKYVLTLTRDQAITAKNALELYARLKIGQFERITDLMLDIKGIDDYCQRRDLANDLLKIVACIIFGKNEYGQPDAKKDALHHRAWNIYATLRYHMAWHDDPGGNTWSVAFDKPYPYGGESIPGCRVVPGNGEDNA